MENKTSHIIKHDIRYLNNGRVTQNYPIKSTRINSTNIKNMRVTNGKLFNEKFTLASQENNKNEITLNKSSRITSWLLNTLNPINHIPIISTINKMANKTNKSLDVVQAAIGGALYGGGPIGLAKGISSWFLGKFIPINKVAINKKSVKDSSSTSNTLRDTTTNNKKSIKPSKVLLEDSKENLSKLNNIPAVKKKPLNDNFFYYQPIETKKKASLIDTDA